MSIIPLLFTNGIINDTNVLFYVSESSIFEQNQIKVSKQISDSHTNVLLKLSNSICFNEWQM